VEKAKTIGLNAQGFIGESAQYMDTEPTNSNSRETNRNSTSSRKRGKVFIFVQANTLRNVMTLTQP